MIKWLEDRIDAMVTARFNYLLHNYTEGIPPFGNTGREIIARVARSAVKDYLEEQAEKENSTP